MKKHIYRYTDIVLGAAYGSYLNYLVDSLIDGSLAAGNTKERQRSQHKPREEAAGAQPFRVVVGRGDGNHHVDRCKYEKVVNQYQPS